MLFCVFYVEAKEETKKEKESSEKKNEMRSHLLLKPAEIRAKRDNKRFSHTHNFHNVQFAFSLCLLQLPCEVAVAFLLSRHHEKRCTYIVYVRLWHICWLFFLLFFFVVADEFECVRMYWTHKTLLLDICRIYFFYCCLFHIHFFLTVLFSLAPSFRLSFVIFASYTQSRRAH